jgi:hypothetical protein
VVFLLDASIILRVLFVKNKDICRKCIMDYARRKGGWSNIGRSMDSIPTSYGGKWDREWDNGTLLWCTSEYDENLRGEGRCRDDICLGGLVYDVTRSGSWLRNFCPYHLEHILAKEES